LDGGCQIRQPKTPTPPEVQAGEDIVHAISNNGITYDVGSSHPGGVEAPKGWAVRPLKRHASWVQTVKQLLAISL